MPRDLLQLRIDIQRVNWKVLQIYPAAEQVKHTLLVVEQGAHAPSVIAGIGAVIIGVAGVIVAHEPNGQPSWMVM